MNSRQGLTLTLFCAVALGLFSLVAEISTATAAHQHGGAPFTILASKSKHGEYKSSLHAKLAPGEKHTFFWKVTNRHVTQQELEFDDAATGDNPSTGYKVSWFKGKKQKRDISHDVQTSGFEYVLPGGKSKYFNAVVKTDAKPQSNFCLGGQTGSTMIPYYDGAYIGLNGDCI
jgi:hypothetical protein